MVSRPGAEIRVYGAIFFRIRKGSFAISVTGMLCHTFVCPKCHGMLYFTCRMVGPSLDIRESLVHLPT